MICPTCEFTLYACASCGVLRCKCKLFRYGVDTGQFEHWYEHPSVPLPPLPRKPWYPAEIAAARKAVFAWR